jgi:hypothetical protein
MTCLPLWNVCSTSPCPWVLSTRWSDRSSYDSYAADPQQAGWVYYVFSTHTITYSLLTLFVLGPFIVFAIRALRRLADATAVHLPAIADLHAH